MSLDRNVQSDAPKRIMCFYPSSVGTKLSVIGKKMNEKSQAKKELVISLFYLNVFLLV